VDVNALVGQYGLPLAMLIMVITAFVRGDVVPGYVYKDALSQRDRALAVAERLSSAADAATAVVERIVRPVKNRDRS
jgi:hypothetical protein